MGVDLVADNGVVHGVDTVLTPPSVSNNIVDLAAANDNLSTLVSAVVAADLADALSGEGPLTVFAPTNDAFNALPAGVLDSLLLPGNVDQLRNVLLYHVVSANALSSSLVNEDIKTLNGDNVKITVMGSEVMVNDAKVIVADVIASNGIVHVIDAVLLPPANSIHDIITDIDDFSTLASAVDAADLSDVLSSGDGPYTVFTPDNKAFEKLPSSLLTKLLTPVWQPQLQDVILYHTVGGAILSSDLSDGLVAATLNYQANTLSINLDPPRVNGGSKILIGAGLVDLKADNGVVHGVDTVLTPPSISNNIVDTAVGNDNLSTLVSAVVAAELVDALSGEGPLTVFAPTNDAFNKLPAGVLDSLLLPANIDQLKDVLLYHVVAANALSSSLVNGVIKTLNGDNVKIAVTGSGVMVNDADVILANVIASNGVVHVIDEVLLPPSVSKNVIISYDSALYNVCAGEMA